MMPPAQAEDANPLELTATGRGAFDQYQSVLRCNAVLENLSDTAPIEERAPDIALGRHYTVKFAEFVLESGTIVTSDGALVPVESLFSDLEEAHRLWLAAWADSENASRLEARALNPCLMLFGHEW